MTDEPRSPAERLLEVLVFAPAGLALTAVEEFPRLAEKGRHRIEGQLHAARLVGQFAVQMGRSQLEKAVHRTPAPPAAPPRSAPGADDTSWTNTSGPSDATTTTRDDGDDPVGTGVGSNGTHVPADLAIPGYDTLSAPQVVQRLGGLSASELEEVRVYELGNRHRRTILNRVDQLLGASDTAPPG